MAEGPPKHMIADIDAKLGAEVRDPKLGAEAGLGIKDLDDPYGGADPKGQCTVILTLVLTCGGAMRWLQPLTDDLAR